MAGGHQKIWIGLAASANRNGDMGVNAVERTYGISKSIIKRHLKRSNSYANNEIRYFGHICVFTAEMEQLLEEHVLKIDIRLFGVSPLELRRKPYDLAEQNNLTIILIKRRH